MKNIVMDTYQDIFLIMVLDETKNKPHEYIVCRNYDDKTSKWLHANYFKELYRATECFYDRRADLINELL